MINLVKNLKCEYSEKITALLNKKVSFAVSGITNCAKLILLSQLLEKNNKKVVFVVDTEQNALKFQNDLKNLFEINATIFPYQDGSIYDTNSKNLYKYAKQVQILNDFFSEKIVIIPQKALFEKFADFPFFKEKNVLIKKDEDINVKELSETLVKYGYKRKTLVADVGEFSIRGDIIDIFSLNEHPYRIELWGDMVVDIRTFDNSTQRSISKLNEINISPIYKFVLNENSYKKIEKSIDFDDEKQVELLEELKNQNYFEGIEYYENLFNEDLTVLPNLIDKDFIFVFDDYTQFKSRYEQTVENLEKQYDENVKTKLSLPLKNKNHLSLKEFLTSVSGFQKVYFDNFISDEFDINIELTTELMPYFASGLSDIAKFISEKLKQKYRIIIATEYKNRVEEILKENEIPFSYEISDKNVVNITNNIVLKGSIIEDCKLIIVTDKELFNKRSKDITGIRYNYRRENMDFIESLNDIKDGDYVVHMIHGIGIFEGLSKQVIDNEEKDYLTLRYAKGDKLHIPAEQINMLCRYRGSGSVLPTLSKMGGNDWNNTKTKVKKAVEEVAQDLINLYAMRKISQGFAFEPDTVWQYEVEDAFGYTETPDQMKAITETKKDMESDKPMDRLICGDVGFGKTEVAIRAIFKAVMSSKQAVIVVPTTILALQHYQTIAERFKPFPIKVELLSRFKSAKE